MRFVQVGVGVSDFLICTSCHRGDQIYKRLMNYIIWERSGERGALSQTCVYNDERRGVKVAWNYRDVDAHGKYSLLK
jgi:hypothetical protein